MPDSKQPKQETLSKQRICCLALTELAADFEREALALYHAGKDGSDWQEAHRRVKLALSNREDSNQPKHGSR